MGEDIKTVSAMHQRQNQLFKWLFIIDQLFVELDRYSIFGADGNILIRYIDQYKLILQ